ncbi:MAG: serine/threonine-protein phosphatase [Clostridiales bacterium]|jgi:serine/threonine protein phosphatase PrpC|nr:serine/threonine-protein phosphatase [Clostridiales bacterium]
MEAYAYTNPGGRNVNEDSMLCEYDGERGLFLVADGLGGHSHGEIASALARDSIRDELSACSDITPDALRFALRHAGDAILLRQQESGQRSMKSTAVVLSICDGRALWAHVGDSRLWYFRDGKIAGVTRDQSVSYKKFASGEISYAGINTDEDRSALLAALGSKGRGEPEVREEPWTLRPGDAFLLCSDGFWEYLHETELLIDLLKSRTPREWAENMLVRMLPRMRPNSDNLSVITVMIN